ncbi:target of Myb protein 1 isoform X2 [Colossoma macropomum]|uniref:target of Myb protein 1 isoform X2 n=1 Tax=Colossoma macropomum TaxID=42526 RepID=UPI001863E4D6|nr:target of Myb protein 1 isoform X2 [Colossoma macropomum]
MDFLIGNPFSTPVGQRIEYATSSSLQSEDWGLNMEICDIVNETEEGPKDAVRAIKKRIVGNKNFREVMLALTVLEACVKNCGHRFHLLVSTREFVEGVLVQTILPKNEPPLVLHDRVLSIIQAWADAFRSSPDLTGVVFVYEDLRRKGLEFPMTELENCSPIHTPIKRVPDQKFPVTMSEAPLSPTHPAQSPPQTPTMQNTEGPITLSPDQVKKLKADLEVVRSNLRVMSDIMIQMDPGRIQKSDAELLQQLYSSCKATQERVVHLIPRVTEETLVEQLLVANDDMNATFTRYHSFERHLNRQNTGQSCPTYGNLIDLNSASKSHNQSKQSTPIHKPISHTVGSLSSQMAGLSTKVEGHAQKQHHSSARLQNRDSEENSTVLDELAAGQTRLHNAGVIPVDQSGVMDDIERWLDVDDDDDLADSEGVTSEEFDRFLAERAKAAERLPSVKASSRDHLPSKPQ